MENGELKKGYKRTEVGIIPNDWDVKQLSSALKTKPQYGINAPAVNYDGNLPIYIRITDISEDGYFAPETIVAVDHKNSNQFYLEEGDIVFARTGASVGKSYFYNILDGKLVYAGFLIKIRPDHNQLIADFLAQYVKTKVYWDWVKIMSMRSGQPGINGNEFGQLLIPFPKIKEQRTIATALSDVDALIAALDKLIAKKRAIKTAAMQQLLTGKKRLPGFSGVWSEISIGAEIDLLTGFPFPSDNYSDSGIRLLRGANIKRGVTDWTDDITQYWPKVTSDIRKYILEEGDIVIAMDGSLVGRSFAQLSVSDLPALLLQRVARIRSTRLDMGYLKEWICSFYFTDHCYSVKTVTAIPHISPNDIKNFKIKVPPTKEEQKLIAEVLSNMETEITALESRRNKTQSIKQGMMQELLTGRTRLI